MSQSLVKNQVHLGSRFRGAAPFFALLALLVVGVVPSDVNGGQLTWEYSPYRVHVWLAVWPSAEIADSLYARIERGVSRQCEVLAGATWILTIRKAPVSLSSDIAASVETITVDQIEGAVEGDLAADKLFLLGVRREDGRFVVACRELDLYTRVLGRVSRRDLWQTRRLPMEAALAVGRAFAPLARVEGSRGRSAEVRVRAGGLVRHEHCPSIISQGDVLRGVIRRTNRQGELEPGGIQVVDWTYLLVRDAQDYLLSCEVYSSTRNPLAGRSSPRVERLALRVRAPDRPTVLNVLSQSPAAKPLEGYKVFAKDPLLKDALLKGAGKKNQAEFLGRTDWRGAIQIPVGNLPLRLVYVKNGAHLIARLPIIPGDKSTLSVQLSSDDRRLEAEAFVKGMESTVMDLVGRREILAERIRRRLKQQKFDEARALLDEIKAFKTRDDLGRMIVDRQQMGLGSADEREQLRIDHLLTGTRQLLQDHLSPDLVAGLEREVAQAESKTRP